MATTNAVPAVESGAITTEKQTYRSYVQLGADKDGKTIVEKIKSQAEAAAKNKNGVATNWAKLEEEKDKDGNPVWQLFNENEFIRYTVKSLDAFTTLVPEEAQQIYIIQSGLNYLQNAKANGAMTAMKDGAPEPTPLFNQETIDLRVGVGENGEYSINEAPSRKSLTDVEKLEKMLAAMGYAPEQVQVALATLAATQAAGAVTEEAQQ